MKTLPWISSIIVLSLGTIVAAPVREADVIVYGDASAGVTAAVQAAKMGKSVILVSQYGVSGGLVELTTA